MVVGSTNVVELSGLRDKLTNTYPTTATVTLGLVDATGTPVTGATAISMTLVSGTTGAATLYRGTIAASIALTAQTYVATVTAAYSGSTRLFTISCPAVLA